MEENNQELNNAVMDTPIPAAEPIPETPTPEAPVMEAAPVEVPAEPVVPEMPVEATPVVEEAAPAEMPAMDPMMGAAPAMEAAPVETPMPVVEPTPAEVPVEPAMPETPVVEAAPVETPMPVVEPTPMAPTPELATELPVVEPAPTVNEMPEAPVAMGPTQEPVGMETPAMDAGAPMGEPAPVEEKKENNTVLIIIVAVLAVAVLVGLYFILFGKSNNTPTPKPATKVVEREAKYYKDDNNNELTIYNDNNSYVLVLDDVTYTGSFTKEDSTLTFAGGNKYSGTACLSAADLTFKMTLNEEGKYVGEEGIVSGLTYSEVSKGDVKAFTEPECVDEEPAEGEGGGKPEETTAEENSTAAAAKPEEVAVESVSLDKTEYTLKIGETVDLVAMITPETASNKTVEWSTDKKKIATVKNGKVTAVAAGTAVITVKTKDGGKKATCTITVEKAEEETATASTTLDKPNCTYDVEAVNTKDSGKYNQFKSGVTSKGEDAGKNAAKACQTRTEIIEAVKAAVKEEAEKCWKDEYVNKAIETAECNLTRDCNDDSNGKIATIEQLWENNNCTGLTF